MILVSFKCSQYTWRMTNFTKILFLRYLLSPRYWIKFKSFIFSIIFCNSIGFFMDHKKINFLWACAKFSGWNFAQDQIFFLQIITISSNVYGHRRAFRPFFEVDIFILIKSSDLLFHSYIQMLSYHIVYQYIESSANCIALH